MAAAITTQREAQQARRALSACYICAHSLPPKATSEWKIGTKAEHVIPKTMLKLAPAMAGNDWPLVLDVHGECEDEHKRGRDQLAKLMQQFGGAGTKALSEAELNLLRKHHPVGTIEVNGSSQPVIENVEDAILAAFLWARGMHAALYGECLPEEVGHVTRPPALIYDPKLGDPTTAQSHENAMIGGLLGTVSRARREGKLDRVVLRGGAIEYSCTWMKIPVECDEPWWCFWALDLPGCPEWATRARGQDAPWYGAYTLAAKPLRASEVELPAEFFNSPQ